MLGLHRTVAGEGLEGTTRNRGISAGAEAYTTHSPCPMDRNQANSSPALTSPAPSQLSSPEAAQEVKDGGHLPHALHLLHLRLNLLRRHLALDDLADGGDCSGSGGRRKGGQGGGLGKLSSSSVKAAPSELDTTLLAIPNEAKQTHSKLRHSAHASQSRLLRQPGS